MALRGLTVAEMFAISAPWVKKGSPARAALGNVPLLAALLPRIDEAHTAIQAIATQNDDPRIKRISEEQADLDNRHDALVRGIYGALTALASVSEPDDELLQIRDMLFPEGLEHTRKTYRGEAGHAALVASHVDKTLQARMKAIRLHNTTLLALVDEWFAVAKKLGDTEIERARIGAPATTPQGQINAARLQWVRVANALVASADLAEIDADTDRLLFASLRAAERIAGGRGRRAPAPPTPAPGSPAPATSEG